MRWSRALPALWLCLAAVTACSGQKAQQEGERVTAQKEHVYSNRLTDETSPYLLQHAQNPVDWYPWGETAFKKARTENKPIFLSIGYSACHWCHVMERESFESEIIAEVMNSNFVAIKVDREERPDVDEIYMMAVQRMTGSGGWPLSVFLTPDLKPFFGGTYFPPDDSFGRPGFKRVLDGIALAWREDQDGIQQQADHVAAALQQQNQEMVGISQIAVGTNNDALAQTYRAAGDRAAETLASSFDSSRGGFGPAPKFPATGSISLLLRQYARAKNESLAVMVTRTLDAMALGGMYDQLGGGFHRYSTDANWLVPHFEKMLYDNALLSQAYLEAFQVIQKPLYRVVATETLDYVLRDMTDASGGFHSAEDADSEGEEGKYYVWSQEEIVSLLGDDVGKSFCDHYGVTAHGNFEEKNILHIPKPDAKGHTRGRMSASRAKLLGARAKRIRPGKDDKVLAAWNGMMISSLAKGYQVLGEKRFRVAAERAGDFILSKMIVKDQLHRSYRRGKVRIPGYLDDYAYVANSFVDLYETSFEIKWLSAAEKLVARMTELFWDEEGHGFFSTGKEHRNLLIRSKSYSDGSVPAGNTIAAMTLMRSARLTDSAEHREKVIQILAAASSLAKEYPVAHMRMICAGEFYVGPGREIAIVGELGEEKTELLLRAVRSAYLPNKVVAFIDPARDTKLVTDRIPLLVGRSTIDGRSAAYVCSNYSCKKPVTDPDELGKVLASTP